MSLKTIWHANRMKLKTNVTVPKFFNFSSGIKQYSNTQRMKSGMQAFVVTNGEFLLKWNISVPKTNGCYLRN